MLANTQRQKRGTSLKRHCSEMSLLHSAHTMGEFKRDKIGMVRTIESGDYCATHDDLRDMSSLIYVSKTFKVQYSVFIKQA